MTLLRSLSFVRNGLRFFLFYSIIGSPLLAGPDDLFYPLRQEWGTDDRGINISVYVFNDVNDNGIYDLGDRAFSGIATGVLKDGTPLSVARSNLNGFANHEASATTPNAPLSDLGTYEFEVFIPPGWKVTTQNRLQSRELVEIPGSAAGVGLTEMIHPVGLSRYLFIRGTYDMPQSGNLVLRQNGKIVASQSLSPGEQFLLPVERGDFELESEAFHRSVKVRDNPVDIGKIANYPTSAPEGSTIDFDDMALTGLQKAPNGYAGLNWFNLNIFSPVLVPEAIGYLNGATSGINILYTSSGHPATISSETPFGFIAANLTVSAVDAEGEEAVFEFYRDDKLVLSDRIGLSAYGPVTYRPRVADITRIELSTVHNWHLIIDDLEVMLE